MTVRELRDMILRTENVSGLLEVNGRTCLDGQILMDVCSLCHDPRPHDLDLQLETWRYISKE